MELRKNQRFDLRLPYEISRAGYRAKVTGNTRNLSSCGILLATSTLIPLGEKIEYSITLPQAPGADAQVKIKGIGRISRRLPEEGLLAVSIESYELVREVNTPMVLAASAVAGMIASRLPGWPSAMRP
jgi:hypothetical protein